jgi:two-component system response regulator (stage 0 sporulation protein F)
MAKLLIVDDEIDVREFAANFFRKRKIEVSTAGSGEEALELLKNQQPNLILLDIKMPGIDGIETLRRLRQNDKNIRVIMVTGQKPDEASASDQCKELGILDYIHKPLELGELERVVMNSLK